MLTLGLLFCPDYTQNLSMKGFLHDADSLEVDRAKGDNCLPSLFPLLHYHDEVITVPFLSYITCPGEGHDRTL